MTGFSMTGADMIPRADMCGPCQADTDEGKGNVTVREEHETIPDPNDGALCRRCGVRTRAE
jgi:hypothetical protein